MYRAAALIASVLSMNAQAQCDWRVTAAAAGVTALDWAQTRYIAKHPDQFRELNPLLGSSPTMGDVNRLFALNMAVVVLGGMYLPAQYCTVVGGVYISLRTVVVARNAYLGVRLDF